MLKLGEKSQVLQGREDTLRKRGRWPFTEGKKGYFLEGRASENARDRWKRKMALPFFATGKKKKGNPETSLSYGRLQGGSEVPRGGKKKKTVQDRKSYP